MLGIGIDTRGITSHLALPLLIRHQGGLVVEMTDGTAEYNAADRHHEGFYYDLVKAAGQRMTVAQAYELRPHQGAAVAVTPGRMRSEDMLDFYGVTEGPGLDDRALDRMLSLGDVGRTREDELAAAEGLVDPLPDIVDVDADRGQRLNRVGGPDSSQPIGGQR